MQRALGRVECLTNLRLGPKPRSGHDVCFPHMIRKGKQACFTCQAQLNTASNLITQEVLLFVFQQDLESSLVRALNTDQQDVAQDLRERLQGIDAVVKEVQAIKSAGGSEQADASPVDISDTFRLRSSLQEAVMGERYEEAAKLRDELRVLQEKLDAVSGKADAANERLKSQRQLRLGQRVIHQDAGYRALVCGWDASCSESEDWQASAGVDDLQQGADQPFYQLLVDIRDADKVGDRKAGLIAYVPQEALKCPERHEDWAEEYGGVGFANPFLYKLFLGKDEKGDFLPARALREKYSQERRDVYLSDDEDDESEKEDSSDDTPGNTPGNSSDADMLNRLFGKSDDSPPDERLP